MTQYSPEARIMDLRQTISILETQNQELTRKIRAVREDERRRIATMAIQGKDGRPDEIVEHAVWVADTLIAELDRKTGN